MLKHVVGLIGLLMIMGFGFFLPNTYAIAQSPSCLEILIPLYIYPNWYDAPNYQWDDVAAADAKVPVVAIVNPASGPTATPNADYVQGMNDLQAGGVQMIGYVRTNYADQPIATVKAEIDVYAAEWDTWITGIFFDEVATGTADLAYYEDIYEYAKRSFELVVVNPGTTPDEGYFSSPVADVGTVFEGFSADWTPYTPPAYFSGYAPTRFSMMVHGTPDAATMEAHIDAAAVRGYGYVYVTDDELVPNPWDSLPSFWAAEVDYIEQVNESCVPTKVGLVSAESAAAFDMLPVLIVVMLGGLTVLLGVRFKKEEPSS